MNTRIGLLQHRETSSSRTLYYVLGVSLLFAVVFTTQGVPWFWRASFLSRCYAVFMAFLSVSILFLLASIRRWAFVAVLVSSTVSSAIAAYFVQTYGIHINENTIGLLYETDIPEAMGLIGADLAIVASAAIVVPAVLGFLLPT